MVLTEQHHRFLDQCRVGRLATADATGAPHVVPVCYAIALDNLYSTIDRKPKRHARPLKRLRNLAANPFAAVVVDHYEEDWSRIGWVMLRGHAEILLGGAEHAQAQALLRRRYPQYALMPLSDLPVIALRIARVTGWGNLDL